MRMTFPAAVAAALAAALPAAIAAYDWPQFGFDPQHSGFNSLEKELTVENVKGLKKIFEVALPAATEAQPAFVSGVTTPKGFKDLVIVAGVEGHVTAFDAYNGETVWSKQFATGHWVQSGPAIDPDRQFVYSIGRDGAAHKLRIADGTETTGNGWPVKVAHNDDRKPSSLSIAKARNGHSYLYACVSGGGSPLIGACATVDLSDNSRHVFNAVCSKHDGFYGGAGAPGCDDAGGNPWGRAGATYHAGLDRILFTTGDNEGKGFNPGAGNWSHSLVALRADGSSDNGTPLDSYTATPTGHTADLASSGPGYVTDMPGSKYKYLALLGAKDKKLRFLNLEDMSGKGKPGEIGGHLGTTMIETPQSGLIYSHPVIWKNPADGTFWGFVGTERGICGLQMKADGTGMPTLEFKWTYRSNFTTTALVANGVVYVHDGGGQIQFWNGNKNVYAMNALTGEILWKDAIQHHHWSSPIVANGVLYVPDGTVAENGSSGTATLKAYALTSDKHPEPASLGRAPLERDVHARVHRGILRLRLARPGSAAIFLAGLDGRVLLDTPADGGAAHEIRLPEASGLFVLRLRQGGEEARILLRGE